MEINRFKASDAEELVTWFTSLEDYVLWGGRTFGWPLKATSIIERSQEPHVELYTFSESSPLPEASSGSNNRELIGFMERPELGGYFARFKANGEAILPGRIKPCTYSGPDQ